MTVKQMFALVMISICLFALNACSDADKTAKTKPGTEAKEAEVSTTSEKPTDGILTMDFINVSYGIQFCSLENKGAEQAAKDNGVIINVNAPQDVTQIDVQVDMLNSAISRRPSAVLFCTLDSKSATASLLTAKKEGIPVIGFDSGVMDHPPGTIAAKVSTDNEAAAGLVTEMMMKEPEFFEAVKKGTPEKPAVVAVITSDITGTTVYERTKGFVESMKAAGEKIFPDGVAVQGHGKFEKASENKPSFIIYVVVSPTPADSDVKNAAQDMINKENLIGFFCTNEPAVTAVLSVTADGTELDRTKGKYKGMIAVGFDAGKSLKNAVRQQWFYGAVTQDPFQIGYQSVMLAIKAAKGEEVSDVTAPAKWYDYRNMEDPEIAPLLYD